MSKISFSKTYITKIHTNINQTNSIKVKKIEFVIYPLFFLLLWPNTRQATEENKFIWRGPRITVWKACQQQLDMGLVTSHLESGSRNRQEVGLAYETSACESHKTSRPHRESLPPS